MNNFLLQDFVFAAISVILGAIAVFFIFWLLKKSPISNWFNSSEAIVASFIGVPAFLFGLAISSYATDIWNNHQAANLSLVNETTAIGSLIRISQILPAEDKQKLTSAVSNYVSAIVNNEWPAMMGGDDTNFDLAKSKLEELTNVVHAIAIKPNQEASIVNRLDNNIDTLYRERLIRLTLAYDDASLARRPSIYVLSFLLLFTVGILQLKNPKAMKISLILGALCIGSSMVFLFSNISPYHGPISIKPTMLMEFISKLI